MTPREQKIIGYLKAGLTIAEIAAEEGVSGPTARRWARELGLRARKLATKTLAERVEEMTPNEAVPFLLNALYLLDEAMCGVEGHEVDGWDCGFTPAERRTVILLVDNAGSMVTRDAVYAAGLFNGQDKEPHPKIVCARMCNIRKKLPASVGRIETGWGRGFRFVRAST